MPRGDGTGPQGGGPGTGRGMGRRSTGQGKGRSTGSDRLGRMGGTRQGIGPGGECVCPKCGATAPHQLGDPCYKVKCPKCGSSMARA